MIKIHGSIQGKHKNTKRSIINQVHTGHSPGETELENYTATAPSRAYTRMNECIIPACVASKRDKPLCCSMVPVDSKAVRSVTDLGSAISVFKYPANHRPDSETCSGLQINQDARDSGSIGMSNTVITYMYQRKGMFLIPSASQICE